MYTYWKELNALVGRHLHHNPPKYPNYAKNVREALIVMTHVAAQHPEVVFGLTYQAQTDGYEWECSVVDVVKNSLMAESAGLPGEAICRALLKYKGLTLPPRFTSPQFSDGDGS